MRYVFLILVGIMLSGCDNESKNYIRERILVKICFNGTKIYSWHGEYWIPGPVWPDQKIQDLNVCQ